MSRKKVLFLCTGNSARSQMAEGLLRHEKGDRFEVFSAGTRPSQVRPEAIVVMKELGIDISDHRSKSVDEFAGQSIEHVITLCDDARAHVLCFRAPRNNLTGAWRIRRPRQARRSSVSPNSAESGIRSATASGISDLVWLSRS